MEERKNRGRSRLAGEERRLAVALASLVGWSGPDFDEFIEYWGNEPGRWWKSGTPVEGAPRMSKRLHRGLKELHGRDRKSLVATVAQWPGEAVFYGEGRYPAGLKEMKSPPASVHLLGRPEVLEEPGLAVVGSRKIGKRAARAATGILEGAVRKGVILVSGGALGSDGIAHQVCVTNRRPTIVVLPSGLGKWTPRSHQKLFERVLAEGGLLLSEYAPDEEVRKYHFRRRNELIAALSKGVFVLRAAVESGTMLTVKAAEGLDRPLAAMPGEPDDPLSVGCHRILRSGGELVASCEDLLQWWRGIGGSESAGLVNRDEKGGEKQVSFSPGCPVLTKAGEILDEERAFSLEALVRTTGRPAGELQGLLLSHELSGFVERLDDGERFRLTW